MSSPTNDKESLRRKYDEIGGLYSSRYADPASVARHQVALVSRWRQKLAPGATVLEIGCADGFVTEALARFGFVVTAVDISPVMIDAARRRLTDLDLPATFVTADVDTLDLGRRFDAV